VEVSGGGFVTSRVALEGSVVIPQDQSFDWTYAYVGISTNRASVSDLRVIGYVRLNAGCDGPVCFQPVFGGGVNRRHAESIETADCGDRVIPHPCIPVSTSQISEESDETAFVISFGVDVSLRVLGWMQIGPTLRFDYVDYGAFLFPDPGVDHRGPGNSGTWGMRVGARIALGR